MKENLYEDFINLPIELENSSDERISSKMKISQWLNEPFLGYKIPVLWLLTAVSLHSVDVISIGLCLWYLRGLTKGKKDTFLLSNQKSKIFGFIRNRKGEICDYGISRQRKSRALKKMEEAGLIKVDRRPGRSPLVTILGIGF